MMTEKEQIIIDGKGCRYRTWGKDCALTGDNHGDNMKPCKFIDEKNCYYKQLQKEKFENLNNRQMVESAENLIYENSELYKNLKEKEKEYEENKKLKKECEELKSESFTREELISLQEKDIDRYRKALEPFQDEYFKGLDTTVIAELAKKSIRITKEHCSDLQKIEELQQECKKLKERATIAEDNFACEVQARLYHQNEWLKFSNECEELKKQLKTSEKWRINAESLNEKLDIKNTRYSKALEKIEQELKEDIYCESQECGCDDFEECLKCLKEHILDIINKAKDGK